MKQAIIVVLVAILLSSCERSKEDLKTIEHFHQINIEDRKQGFMRDTSYAEAVREWKVGKDNSRRDYYTTNTNSSKPPTVMPIIVIPISHK
jgi:hypothetical protein